MAENLDDLFAELRADTMHRVRPPGPDRVRRTVRRRRTTTVSFAGLLLLVLGGTVTLLGLPSRPTAPASRDPLNTTELDVLARTAERAVTAGDPGQPLFARRGAVTGGFRATEQIFLGEITLQIACAGTGSVTLLVRGVPGAESNTTERPEVARLTAGCSADPRPVGTTFVLEQFLNLSVEVRDAGSARDRAAFAYRATSDTGVPVLRNAMRPAEALNLPEPLPSGSGPGGDLEIFSRRNTEWNALDGDFRLAVACAGTGTLRVTVRQARDADDPDGTVSSAETYDTTCRYPPQRQDFVLGDIRRQVSLTVEYETTSSAPARAAFQFLPR